MPLVTKREGRVYRASIDLPEALHNEVKDAAYERGQTTRGFFLCALRDYLSKMKNCREAQA